MIKFLPFLTDAWRLLRITEMEEAKDGFSATINTVRIFSST